MKQAKESDRRTEPSNVAQAALSTGTNLGPSLPMGNNVGTLERSDEIPAQSLEQEFQKSSQPSAYNKSRAMNKSGARNKKKKSTILASSCQSFRSRIVW